MSVLQPRTIVELGTHGGYSYFTFCQAVRTLGLSTRCYAVDTWKGDAHAGFYGDEIFQGVVRHNEENYGDFSELLRCTFQEALPRFADGSIDLLHIDGCHSYDLVKSDYKSWRSKLSDRSVVLFHDTAVLDRGFGVHRLWDELKSERPGFAFVHCYGLGVLGYGPDLPPAIALLLEEMADTEALSTMREIYSRLGSTISAEIQRKAEVGQLARQIHALQHQVSTLGAEAQALRRAQSTATMALRRKEKTRSATRDKTKALRKVHRKQKARMHHLVARLKEQDSFRWWLARPWRKLSRLVSPALGAKRHKHKDPASEILPAPEGERNSKRRRKGAGRRPAEAASGSAREGGAAKRARGSNGKDRSGKNKARPASVDPTPARQDAEVTTAQALVIPFGEIEGAAPQPASTVAVHLHLFYVEMLDEFVGRLRNISFPFDLYVSVAGEPNRDAVGERLRSDVPLARNLVVKAVENRGRDLKPFFCDFGPTLVSYDLVCHIHSKKSPHNRRKSDWRRQLLHNIIGSPKTVAEIVGLFEGQPTLGLVFPEYHPELANQIGWGGNRDLAVHLAGRMGLAEPPAQLSLFSAGSMFWTRGKAMAPLVDVLADDDFPDEEGQVDGTMAHAIERLFAGAVVQGGYSAVQVTADIAYSGANVYALNRRYEHPGESRLAENILRYRRERTAGNRTAVFTAITGGYEDLLIPEYLDPRLDYLCFVDRSQNDLGMYDVRPIQYFSIDPTRSARFVKTHPHILLDDYDVAIWIDANVLIKSDLSAFIDGVLESGRPFGTIAHPMRSSVYEEADECTRARKDRPATIRRQIARYRAEGLPAETGLIESNLMVWNLRHPSTRRILDLWWREIENGSRRDQLSLPYVLWRLGETWHSLLSENHSVRDHPGFAFFRHGAQQDRPIPNPLVVPQRFIDPLVPSEPYSAVKEERLRHLTDRTIDIVLCIHNALTYAVACLESVEPTMLPAHRLILVDDGSDPETADYLTGFAASRPNTILHRNPVAQGYTRAANIGLRLSTAEIVILLNSDTVVAGDWQLKLADALLATPGAGIAGPMSNAASHQSMPDHLGTIDQTAINELPPGVDVAAMNDHCEEWSSADALPFVPVIHGFCLAIRREVIDSIGLFDEESFPSGYGEENDYCFRAADAGFVLVVATHTYVFHAKTKSYAPEVRQKLAGAGTEALRRKYDVARLMITNSSMQANPLLDAMRRKSLTLYAGTGPA